MSSLHRAINKSNPRAVSKEDGRLTKGKSRQYYSAPNLMHHHYYPRHDCGVNQDTRTPFKANPMPQYPSTDSILSSSPHRKHLPKPQSTTQLNTREDWSRSEEASFKPFWLDLADGGNTFHPTKPFYPPGPQSWSEWDRIKRVKEARDVYKSPKTRDLIVKGVINMRRLSLESGRLAKPKNVSEVKNPLRAAKMYSQSLPRINQVATVKRSTRPVKRSGSFKRHTQTEITLLDMERMFPSDNDELEEKDVTDHKYLAAHEMCYSEIIIPVPDRFPGGAHSQHSGTLDDLATSTRSFLSPRQDLTPGINSNLSSPYCQTLDTSRDDFLDSFQHCSNVRYTTNLAAMPQTIAVGVKEALTKNDKEIGSWYHRDIHYQEEKLLPEEIMPTATRSQQRDAEHNGLKRVNIEVSTTKEYRHPSAETESVKNRIAISSIFYPMRKDYQLKGTAGIVDSNNAQPLLLTPLVEKASGFYIEETHSRAGIVQLCSPQGSTDATLNKINRRPRSVILFDDKETLSRPAATSGNDSIQNTKTINTRHGKAPDVVPRDAQESADTRVLKKTPSKDNLNKRTPVYPSKMYVSVGNALDGKSHSGPRKQSTPAVSRTRQSPLPMARGTRHTSEPWKGTPDSYERDDTDTTLSSDNMNQLDLSSRMGSDSSGIGTSFGYNSWSKYDQNICVPVQANLKM